MWVGKKIKQKNVTMKLNKKHKRSIAYNDLYANVRL